MWFPGVESPDRVVEVLELYNPKEEGVSCFAIQYKDPDVDCQWNTLECHVYAKTLNEALGAFFVENEYVNYSEIIDHMEIG